MAKKPARKRSRGRPAYQPTKEQRDLVAMNVAFGIPLEEIALLIKQGSGRPITRKTLSARFAKEIAGGKARADAMVKRSLFLQAVGAPAEFDEKGKQVRAEQPRITVAGIWWTKAQMGWTEKTVNEHSGPDGGAIPIRLDSLNDGQLGQLIERIEEALRSRS